MIGHHHHFTFPVSIDLMPSVTMFYMACACGAQMLNGTNLITSTKGE